MKRRTTEADVAIGLAIRQRRVLAGLTQEQFAARIGVTYQQAHKYETGINRVAAGRLVQIAAALGVEVSDLLQPGATDAVPEPLARALVSIAHSVRSMSPRRRRLLAALARELAI